jgi:hypothetical protein
MGEWADIRGMNQSQTQERIAASCVAPASSREEKFYSELARGLRMLIEAARHDGTVRVGIETMFTWAATIATRSANAPRGTNAAWALRVALEDIVRDNTDISRFLI